MSTNSWHVLITVLLIGAALIWLGVETKWLTIRLLMPTTSLLQMALGMIFIAVGFIMFGTVMEDAIEFLPKYYRRYIKRVRKSSGDVLWLPPCSFHPVLINEMRQKVAITLRKGIENAH